MPDIFLRDYCAGCPTVARLLKHILFRALLGIIFANTLIMQKIPDKILLVDEAGFTRVCSSMLEAEGFRIETINPGADGHMSGLDRQDLNLVIASYPHVNFIFDSLKKLTVPVIVLSDHISEELIFLLKGLRKSYCMTKPLDYGKFKTLVKQLMNGERTHYAGYDIL